MGMQDAVRSFFKRYTDFQGRSSRSEFWWVYLAYIIIYAVFMALTFADPGGAVSMVVSGLFLIFALAIIVPMFAISFRRLHDTDRSAWWLLIGFLPLIGAIVLIVFYVTPGTKGPNRFGPDPLGGGAEVFA